MGKHFFRHGDIASYREDLRCYQCKKSCLKHASQNKCVECFSTLIRRALPQMISRAERRSKIAFQAKNGAKLNQRESRDLCRFDHLMERYTAISAVDWLNRPFEDLSDVDLFVQGLLADGHVLAIRSGIRPITSDSVARKLSVAVNHRIGQTAARVIRGV